MLKCFFLFIDFYLLIFLLIFFFRAFSEKNLFFSNKYFHPPPSPTATLPNRAISGKLSALLCTLFFLRPTLETFFFVTQFRVEEEKKRK